MILKALLWQPFCLEESKFNFSLETCATIDLLVTDFLNDFESYLNKYDFSLLDEIQNPLEQSKNINLQ